MVSLPSNTRWTGISQWFPERAAWMAEGECNGLDPALFYPDQGGDAATPKRICSTCPVRVQCLEYALLTNERHGIWGGVSERERRRMRAERFGPRTGGIPVDEDRRRQVKSMAEFLPATEIARELGLSRKTVCRYLGEAS